MKKLFTFLSFSLSLSLVKADYWTQKADFTGVSRIGTFSFSINDKGYMGTGRDIANSYYNDFWEYDPLTNAWTQKAAFGGSPRFLGLGFSIAGKGYAGLGSIGASVINDFWEYDPAANLWTQKANFGGANRMYPSCFVINNKGYIGIGTDLGWGIFYNDIWEYDPVTDTWTMKTNFPGTPRADAVGFATVNKGYFGTGYSGTDLQDFWEFDPVINSWTQVANFPFTLIDASAFVICNKAYVGTGNTGAGFINDIWQYDAITNQWIQKTNFSGIARDLAVCFSAGNKGYLGVGWIDGGPYYTDLWEYTPDSACATGIEEELSNSNLQFSISPNPAKDYIVISYPLTGKENIAITITDAQGKKVYETKLQATTSNLKLQTSNYPQGIYFVELNNGKQKAVKKFVKE